MKILIIFPPVHPACNSLGMRAAPPLAIYYLSAILKRKYFEVKIIDPIYFYEHNYFKSYNDSVKMINELIDDHYDALAISSNSGNWSIAKFFIDMFRTINKDMPIVVGGVHGNYFDDYILNSTEVNYVIRGEGEETLPKLLSNIGNQDVLRNLKGITYKDNSGKIVRNPDSDLIKSSDLATYPVPDYQLIPKGYYNHIPVETSRGCRYNCLFCSVPHRKTWRPIKKEAVIERVLKVKEIIDNGTTVGNSIYFVDDCFSADTNRAIDILDTINKMNLNITFGLECRITDLLTPEFVEKIPLNIISFIQIGVEAGYDEGLKKIRKGITIKQIEECSSLLRKYGVLEKCYYSFILGFPWEDINDIQKTVNFIGNLGLTYGVRTSVSWLWLCPSDLWKIKDEYNIDIDETVFDDCFWTISKDLFFKTHPKVDVNVYNRIENLIELYKSKGCVISHARLF